MNQFGVPLREDRDATPRDTMPYLAEVWIRGARLYARGATPQQALSILAEKWETIK